MQSAELLLVVKVPTASAWTVADVVITAPIDPDLWCPLPHPGSHSGTYS
jgi:hypothetical protein